MTDDAPIADVLLENDRIERVDGTLLPVGGDLILAIDGQSVSTIVELASPSSQKRKQATE